MGRIQHVWMKSVTMMFAIIVLQQLLWHNTILVEYLHFTLVFGRPKRTSTTQVSLSTWTFETFNEWLQDAHEGHCLELWDVLSTDLAGILLGLSRAGGHQPWTFYIHNPKSFSPSTFIHTSLGLFLPPSFLTMVLFTSSMWCLLKWCTLCGVKKNVVGQ